MLGNEYSAIIRYKIEYIGLPKNFSSLDNLPDELKVTIKTGGFKILMLENQKNYIKIDVKKHAEKDKNDPTKLIISTSKLVNSFFLDTVKMNIIKIEPKIIVINTRNVISKKIPVVPKVDLNCKNLFMQAGEIQLEPDSITIYGLKEVLSSIKQVETEEKTFSDVDNNIETLLSLKSLNEVRFSENQIKITIPIEKYTENLTKVKIEVLNCPSNYRLITFPAEVNISYKVVLSKYDEITKSNFKVGIDFNEIDIDKHSKIKLHLNEYPEFIRDIKMLPEYVEYIVEKID
jgi:YbbR domain-containing protein